MYNIEYGDRNMQSYIKITIVGLLGMILIPIQLEAQDKTVPIIYDTDMGPMTDDVSAIAMLHALADMGEAEVLATVASNRHPTIAQVIDVFNTYYGRPNVPIGVPGGIAVEIKDAPKVCCYGGWTNWIINNYPSDIRSNDVVPTAVEVYRKVLSEQPDNSVVVVTVGFMTNLSELLISRPDEYSDLNGKELVKKKVKKLVSMAGTFTGDVIDPKGPDKEYNVYMDAKAAKHAFEEWPTEIIFSGFALGMKVKSGGPLVKSTEIKNSPVQDVKRMVSSGDSGGSFDQTAILAAVYDVEEFFDLVPGRITLEWDGVNGWDNSGSGHYYLKEKEEGLDHVQNTINDLLLHQPTR